ncbi:MAG: hypothetical protein HY908_21570 [Myxococcales bacterium]|nr:hypothetical protein [Myxococcales bacterium]
MIEPQRDLVRRLLGGATTALLVATLAAEAQAQPAKDAPAPSTTTDDEADDFEWRRHAVFMVGPVTLVPTILLQAQAAPYVGPDSLFQTGDLAERPGFRLRRADFGLAGELFERVRFAASAEVSSDEGGSIAVKDAWLGYTEVPYVQAFVGARTVPFSAAALLGAGGTALFDRPLVVRAMAPFNQVGATVEGVVEAGETGEARAFEYAVGLYNGFQREDFFYRGYRENYAPFGNRFDGVAFAGRLGTQPLGAVGPTVADLEHASFRFGLGTNYFYSHGGARDLHAAGGDARLHVEGFDLHFEGLWSRSIPASVPTQPTAEVATKDSWGLTTEVGYVIVPRLFGLHTRFEWLDPDVVVANEDDDWLLTAGASVELFDRLLKLQAEYTHRQERAGLSLANDSVALQFQFELAGLGDIPAARRAREQEEKAAR